MCDRCLSEQIHCRQTESCNAQSQPGNVIADVSAVRVAYHAEQLRRRLKGKEPREGLAYVDRNGGSSPLTLIIASADGSKLDKKEQYERMWDLEDALEEHKGVGTSLSLPVLMAEANRHKFAFLFGWNHLLNVLNEPKHSRVASTFVTKDRKLAAFYLRIDEHGRTKPPVEVVNDLRKIVRQHGFKVVLVGGAYELQGELAKLVAKSLVEGLLWLMV